MAKDLDDVKPDREARWDAEFNKVDFPKTTYYRHRLLGYVFVWGRHWVESKAGDPTSKKFPRECTNFCPDKEAPVLKNGCPLCEIGMKVTKHYFINVIDRSRQEEGVKDPIRALGPIPPTVMTEIVGLKQLNKDRNNKADGGPKNVTHPEFGCDVNFKYDDKATPKWGVSIDTGGRTPLTEAEKALKLYDFEAAFLPKMDDKDAIEAYNLNTRQSLERGGYFGPKGSNSSDGNGTDDMKRSNVRAPSSVPDDAPPPRRLEQAPEGVSGGAIGNNKPTGGKAKCPHEADGYAYGQYKADKVCNKCPIRGACIQDTPD